MCKDDKVLDSDLFEGATAPTLCQLMGVLREDEPDSDLESAGDPSPDNSGPGSAEAEGR